MIEYINELLSPNMIIILVIVVSLYCILFFSVSNDSTTTIGTSDSNYSMIYALLIAIFIALLIINSGRYFGINIIAKIKDIFTKNPEIDVDVTRVNAINNVPVPEILLKKQVFNIPDNNFVYNDAKALCKAYGARLATYEEVEDAYNKGGEWCNMGWSDGQMALYPTQQSTYDALQKIEGHENDCGRPGVNGGYIDNPKVRFGVNCFGYKPKMTDEEQYLMANEPLYPKTEKDIAMENRVNYWRSQLQSVLVSPFNKTTWSRL